MTTGSSSFTEFIGALAPELLPRDAHCPWAARLSTTWTTIRVAHL